MKHNKALQRYIFHQIYIKKPPPPPPVIKKIKNSNGNLGLYAYITPPIIFGAIGTIGVYCAYCALETATVQNFRTNVYNEFNSIANLIISNSNCNIDHITNITNEYAEKLELAINNPSFLETNNWASGLGSTEPNDTGFSSNFFVTETSNHPSFDEIVDFICKPESNKSLIKEWIGNGLLDINKTNEKGTTLLMVASYYGLDTIVKLFIENEADVNRTNHSGYTALDFAIWGNHLSIARALVESNRLNSNAKNCAMQLADTLKMKKLKKLLKAQGVTLGQSLLDQDCSVSIRSYKGIEKSLF